MYTVYDFQKDARSKIDEIIKRGKTPIVVGGTGLYVTSLLYDYEFNEEVNKKCEIKDEDLYNEILKIDPNTDIHPNNYKRQRRYLEYYLNTGYKLNEKKSSSKMIYDAIVVGLTTKRDILYDRINKRVDKMLLEGLEEEAKKIYDMKIFSKAVMTPIGYKELFKYFDGIISKEDAILEIKKRSRNYAKRQYTWFNNKMDVKWFDVNFTNFDETIDKIEDYISNLN